jgi:hypothetical protein
MLFCAIMFLKKGYARGEALENGSQGLDLG